jgi:hypothetical protein
MKVFINKIVKNIEKMSKRILELIQFIEKQKNFLINYNQEGYTTIGMINNMEDVVHKVIIETNILEREYHSITSPIIDVFMMRRFLDKDYITNGIYYSGGAHSVNIIQMLIKKFDFKITHLDKGSEDINSLNNKIKYSDLFDDEALKYKLFGYFQCSDVTKFPDMFT